jgi:hypothetical protein
MAGPPGETRKHYYQVSLTDGAGVRYTGKGAAVAAARASARTKGLQNGRTNAELDAMDELVESLVGPNPQTFAGNPNIPPGG